jgi:hypothetical protein
MAIRKFSQERNIGTNPFQLLEPIEYSCNNAGDLNHFLGKSTAWASFMAGSIGPSDFPAGVLYIQGVVKE